MSTEVDKARYAIEDAIWRLMNEGWSDERIAIEIMELIESCRADVTPEAS